ncbi:glycoside hydrolase [Lasiosphaeris hirsuta]|uniref:cellulase n=1 Tax=Lasiosphaeris hirsuta TaxID=260670 RepID=A0AA40AP17_9PEZI|nr:glycoside hydrolase [Lasiosphaeris hirsuta]
MTASAHPAATEGTGKSYTGWDCCKPACAWQGNLAKGVSGQPHVCDINNKPLATREGLSAKSGCEKNGTAFLCDTYAPTVVSDTEAYGFVVGFANADCCKCFELTWPTARSARGKTMTVQVINVGDTSTSVTTKDFVIQTPGGGVGPNDAGCRFQYGTTWLVLGNQWGGVTNLGECAALPQNLQKGCDWRWNWAGGDVNGWNINYKQVNCPRKITSISGCSA